MIDGKLQELVNGLFQHYEKNDRQFMSADLIKNKYHYIYEFDLIKLEKKGIINRRNQGKRLNHRLNCFGVRLTDRAYADIKETISSVN